MNYFVMVDCCKMWLLVIVFECYSSCVVKWFIVDHHSWSTHPVFKQRNKPYSLKSVFPLIQSIIKELKTNTARKTRLKYIVQCCRHVNKDRGFFTFLANIMGRRVWCFTPILTIFQLYRGGLFIGGCKRSTRRKPPTCI